MNYARQAPLSIRFSWQDYLSGLSFPPPEDLPDPGIGPESLMSSALAGRFFTTNTPWEVQICLQFSSVTQSCPTLCDLMNGSMPGFPVHHQSQSLLKLMSIELVMPFTHLKLCHPPLFLPSIFPSIRVFSNESGLHIRWPKYWSFSISPSNEYSGLISLGLISLQSKGLSRLFPNTMV